jgi:hypothetical protein
LSIIDWECQQVVCGRTTHAHEVISDNTQRVDNVVLVLVLDERVRVLEPLLLLLARDLGVRKDERHNGLHDSRSALVRSGTRHHEVLAIGDTDRGLEELKNGAREVVQVHLGSIGRVRRRHGGLGGIRVGGDVVAVECRQERGEVQDSDTNVSRYVGSEVAGEAALEGEEYAEDLDTQREAVPRGGDISGSVDSEQLVERAKPHTRHVVEGLADGLGVLVLDGRQHGDDVAVHGDGLGACSKRVVRVAQNREKGRNEVANNRNQLILREVVLDKLEDNAHATVDGIRVTAVQQLHEGGKEVGPVLGPVEAGNARHGERSSGTDLALVVGKGAEEKRANLVLGLGWRRGRSVRFGSRVPMCGNVLLKEDTSRVRKSALGQGAAGDGDTYLTLGEGSGDVTQNAGEAQAALCAC